ncbi:MAG: hypothetical protein QNK34_14540 [Woeseiaceae bacterium]|nr:hypothetical protein [Woeseiaceae bacterium]
MTSQYSRKVLYACVILLSLGLAGTASAQEVRYSWLDLSFMGQDVGGLKGTLQTPVIDQFVDVNAKDGDGVRFRGSYALGESFYFFGDYGSTDIDVDALVTNDQGSFPASDEFDLTTIRGGFGYRYGIGFSTDIYAEISFDSVDYDFGSFAGENFDTDSKDAGVALGIRHMLNDDWEVRANGRYSSQASVDLNTLEFDSGAFFGVGFSWEIVRGLALIGDYETGDVDSWAIGFRLDMDED